MWNRDNYDDRAIGPMGLHDAILLDAICRYVRPRVALEYGGLLGHSLSVMAEYCGAVISVDDNAHQLLYDAAVKFKNVRVVKEDMRVFNPSNINLNDVDLVLFDASHLYKDNVLAFKNVKFFLTSQALILVHDTGEWYEGELPPQWKAFKEERAIFLEHDRKFVKFLRTQGYSDITFQSNEHLRHGYTVLMKPQW